MLKKNRYFVESSFPVRCALKAKREDLGVGDTCKQRGRREDQKALLPNVLTCISYAYHPN